MKIYLLQGSDIRSQIAFTADELKKYLADMLGGTQEWREPYTLEDLVIHIAVEDDNAYQITEFNVLNVPENSTYPEYKKAYNNYHQFKHRLKVAVDDRRIAGLKEKTDEANLIYKRIRTARIWGDEEDEASSSSNV